jgi:hypothetical protein
MRKKIDYQETFNYNPSNSVKIVREYVNKYKMMDLILQENPTIFDLAHADFEKWLSRSKKGREADYTTDQIVRCVLILFFEKWSYRQTVVNVDSNLVLQQFARLEMLPMMDFTFLNKAYCAIQEATWEKINQVLNRYALQKKRLAVRNCGWIVRSTKAISIIQRIHPCCGTVFARWPVCSRS